MGTDDTDDPVMHTTKGYRSLPTTDCENNVFRVISEDFLDIMPDQAYTFIFTV